MMFKRRATEIMKQYCKLEFINSSGYFINVSNLRDSINSAFNSANKGIKFFPNYRQSCNSIYCTPIVSFSLYKMCTPLFTNCNKPIRFDSIAIPLICYLNVPIGFRFATTGLDPRHPHSKPLPVAARERYHNPAALAWLSR